MEVYTIHKRKDSLCIVPRCKRSMQVMVFVGPKLDADFDFGSKGYLIPESKLKEFEREVTNFWSSK